MATWWQDAYSGITSWNVGVDQRNPDRGAQQDAFQMAMAEKGANYDITSRLMGDATRNEVNLAKQAADLDRRNTLDVMTAQHTQTLQGMKTSTQLQKELMGSQYGYTLGTMREAGTQERQTIGTQGTEQRKTIETTGQQERLNIQTSGDEQRKGLVTAGEQERLNIGTRGTEERETIGKTAEETRRTTAFDREHAASLATRYAARH